MIGERVAAAIRTNGSTMTVVAAAADIDEASLNDRLTGREPFTFEELVRVGGFLHLRVPDLFRGAT